MTADLNLGDNYQIDEDSNGDLVIKDETGNNVLRWDNTNNEWNAEGNALRNLASVSTGKATIGGDRVERVGPQQVARAGLRDGLVGHWTLDNLSDGLVDTTDNGNDITTTGSPTVVSNGGAFGDAVQFGEGAYGNIAHNGALSVEDGDFSIACYIRAPDLSVDSQAQAGIVQKRAKATSDVNAAYALALTWTNKRGSVVGSYGDSSSTYLTPDCPKIGEGPLYPVVMTYDSDDNRLTVWVNGESRVTDSFANPPVQQTNDVWVGVKFDGSGNINFRAPITMSDLRIYNRKLSVGEIETHARLPYPSSDIFSVHREGIIFDANIAGPVVRYDESKTDPYRMLAKDYTTSGNPVNLYTTSTPFDVSSWTAASTDVISGYTNASDTEPSDFVYDGSTYYVYMTDQTDDTTQIFSGSDWTGANLTHDSQAVTDPDCGAFLEEGTTYLITEEKDLTVGESSDKLQLYTASSPNGSFSFSRTVLDLRDVPWHSGDIDIEFIDGSYWMFIDNTQTHPYYGTSLLRSSNLYEWELVAEDIKKGRGGDLEVVDTPEGWLGFTELSGDNTAGIDLWTVNGPR